jgi:hypothetical protein
LIYGLVNRRVHPAAKYLLAGGLLTTAIFSHLILHHHHYLMIFSPVTAILCAAAFVEAEQFLFARGLKPGLVTGTLALTALLALFQGLISNYAFSFDVYPKRIDAAIREHTQPEDKLVVVNGGWGGRELFCTRRRGLSVWNAKVFDDPEKLARLKALGFNKLVILSQSPFNNAVNIVNPGQTGIPRTMARDYLTPRIEPWPTVFANDDIIIKDIP